MSDEAIHDDFDDYQEGLCECGKLAWDMCDCGKHFLEWVCGFDPSSGQCRMAGTEDCDWECPRGRP